MLVGAANETVAWLSPRIAFKPVGGLGKPAGVTDALLETEEVPVEFVAVAVNEYAVPFVSGAIEQLVAGEITVHVAPPGLAVTV